MTIPTTLRKFSIAAAGAALTILGVSGAARGATLGVELVQNGNAEMGDIIG